MIAHPSNLMPVAQEAARAAGAHIATWFYRREELAISQKEHANDLVSHVDQLAERTIVEILRAAFPTHAILGEEYGEQRTQQSDYQWIIDPLDGTTNFLHGYAQFGVSIGLTFEQTLILGVVYDPIKDELFYAQKGQGAFLNHQPISVTQPASLSACVIATGFPFREFDFIDQYLAILKRLMLGTQGLRRAGSAALDLCYVAAGRFDAYFEFRLKAWDIAAGALIAQEAGALIVDFAGEGNYLVSGDILAAHPTRAPELLSLIQAPDA
jgi:myo-inositol-1(or 4)-monophosphatase